MDTLMRKKILIVEPNQDVRRLLQMQLGHLGYGTILAPNGAQAIDMAMAQLPELIILDLRLPDMGGLEVVDCVRRIPGTHAIPILAVAESFAPEDQERSLDCGCNDYISKPFTTTLLVTRIQNLTGAYRLNSSRSLNNTPPLRSL